MASDEIKQTIVDYFACDKITSTEKDWKRVQKKKLPSGHFLREFHNATLNRTVYTIGEDEDASVIEKDFWIYGCWYDENGDIGAIAFEPSDRFYRNGCIYDQHQSHILEEVFLVPEAFAINEDMENSFSVNPPYTQLTVHIMLKKHGFTHSQDLTDFLNDKGSTKRPASAPVNPPLPPVLDPSFGKGPSGAPVPAPVAPMSTPTTGSLGGHYGTGLEADGSTKASDFIAIVGEDDGAIQVWITPMLAYARGERFSGQMSELLDHLLPTDWMEISEQEYEPGTLGVVEAYDFLLNAGFHVDWKAYKDEASAYLNVYDVTLEQHKANMDAIANPISTMPVHHHNPVAVGPSNTTYPELTGQEPEVQAALETARSKGVLGLEQEGHNWDDLDEINDKADRDFYLNLHDGEVTLERSHALWLLYEHYDNGSGLAFPNFFGMDNVRVGQELIKLFTFDCVSEEPDEDDDAEHFLYITEDERNYPAPYDLPVPEYVAPAPIITPRTIVTTKAPPAPTKGLMGRSPSLRGPITGGGSFAGVSGTPTKRVDDEVPADATYIAFDSGEQWPEFCGAVWDNYEAHGAGAIRWSDRFRPRHARIIGLGYKFDRLEFTGIRVRMGYLNDKFEIIENIDIPGKVFDELLVEFGGDWNDDENIQFINKRKGEDPETGFSYSSQNLWDEIEPLLKSKGWMPAK